MPNKYGPSYGAQPFNEIQRLQLLTQMKNQYNIDPVTGHQLPGINNNIPQPGITQPRSMIPNPQMGNPMLRPGEPNMADIAQQKLLAERNRMGGGIVPPGIKQVGGPIVDKVPGTDPAAFINRLRERMMGVRPQGDLAPTGRAQRQTARARQRLATPQLPGTM